MKYYVSHIQLTLECEDGVKLTRENCYEGMTVRMTADTDDILAGSTGTVGKLYDPPKLLQDQEGEELSCVFLVVFGTKKELYFAVFWIRIRMDSH